MDLKQRQSMMMKMTIPMKRGVTDRANISDSGSDDEGGNFDNMMRQGNEVNAQSLEGPRKRMATASSY